MPPTWVYLIFPLILIQIYWKFQLSKQTAAANWCSSAALQAPINLPWHEINGTILEVSYCNSHSSGISTVQFNIFLITLFLHCYLCLSLYIRNNTLVSTTLGRKSALINLWMMPSQKSPANPASKRFVTSDTKPFEAGTVLAKTFGSTLRLIPLKSLLAFIIYLSLPLMIASHITFFLCKKRSL